VVPKSEVLLLETGGVTKRNPLGEKGVFKSKTEPQRSGCKGRKEGIEWGGRPCTKSDPLQVSASRQKKARLQREDVESEKGRKVAIL